ncbi:hypothetical protein BH747_09915 [Enterococcus villorum]|uniref:WxL domain-containing protein n=1 Tax=Enterococcus villorum TaxID=112904 RepID=A0A1V8YJ65_9ENTE|nr:WxL domain-containing protein [Enterococcus villorum]OQO69577.1 hypothetical protein BH747_09915 [Enterococcus villorum]OQO72671.1 hypothetical protein BH744_11185 [Enterococcus villorum]
MDESSEKAMGETMDVNEEEKRSQEEVSKKEEKSEEMENGSQNNEKIDEQRPPDLEENSSEKKDKFMSNENVMKEDDLSQLIGRSEPRSQVVLDDDGQYLRYGKWYYIGNFESNRILGSDGRDSWLRRNVNYSLAFRLQAAPGNTSDIVFTGQSFRIDVITPRSPNTVSGVVAEPSGGIRMDGGTVNDGQDIYLAPGWITGYRYFTLKTDTGKRYRIQAAALSSTNNGHWFYHGSSNRVDSAGNTTSSTFGFFNMIQIQSSIGGVGLVNGESRATPALRQPAQLRATASPGYEFDEWRVVDSNNISGGTITSRLNPNTEYYLNDRSNEHTVKITPIFTRKHYKISTNVSPANGGSASVLHGVTSVAYGGTCRIQAIANRPGYRFVRWTVSGAGSSVADVNSGNTIFTMGTENATVTAQFEEISFIAEAEPQTLILGGQFTETQLKKLVKNVTYNGQVLTENDYEVTIVSQPDTDEVGEKTADIIVEYKATGANLSLSVPVTVNWGNALRYKGWGSASVGAFVYHPDAGLITPRWGILNNNTFVNNTEFGMNFYYSFKQFRRTDDSFDIKDLMPVKELSANGNSPADHFTSEGDWATNVGDIIEVKHMQARNRLTIMNNEEEQAVSVKDNQAYFELTKEGYHLLQFDRVETPKVSISKGMTTEELDKEITNYLDMSQAKNVEIVGFTKYPETSKIGESKGTIRVCEKLTTGKYVQKDYEVVFTVESTTLEFQEIDHADFDFGRVKKNSQSQTVSAVGDAAPALTISDFSDSKSWEVRVSQPEGLKDEQNNELLGASIRLKNIQVAQSVHDNILVPARTITLSAVQQSIAQAQTENIGGGKNKGITQLQIGDSRDGKLSGIDIHIPRNTVANASKYRTTIEWELVGDPTLMNG